MRTVGLTVALALVASVAAVGATGSAERQQPRLTLAATSPVAVTGRNFRARERVRLVATLEEQRRSRVVLASTRGTFKVQFETLYQHPCSSSGGTVRASGSRGSAAGAKIPPRPDCPPPA